MKEGRDAIALSIDSNRMFSPQQKVVKLSANEIAQRVNTLYKDANKRKDNLEELTSKYKAEENKKMVQLQHVSKKFILRKFVRQYKSELQKVVENEECKVKNKINFFQLGKLILNLQ